MPSRFQSDEPEPKFDTGTRHYPPSASSGVSIGEEIARYDEAMQQAIIALAGRLQDHERATVSLEQLESVAEEVGLEPRFVREAARRLTASQSPAQPMTPDSLLRRSSQSAFHSLREDCIAEKIAAGERAHTASKEFEEIFVAEGIVYRPIKNNALESSSPNLTSSAQEEPESQLTFSARIRQSAAFVEAGHVPLYKQTKGYINKVLSFIGISISWTFAIIFYLVLHIATIAAYGAIVLFTCIIPMPIIGKMISALFFGGMAAVLTIAIRSLWGATGWPSSKSRVTRRR